MPRDSIEDSEAFLTEVCWHYFINGNTQAEVAKAMGVTRLRVNQAIQKSRNLGLVSIEVDSPFLPRMQLQQKLQDQFGLGRALVAPANQVDYDFHSSVGAALASHLSDRLRTQEWKSLGVSWGVTLEKSIESLRRQSHPDLEIISILGGTSHGSTFNSFGIASGLASVLGAQYSILTAPIYLTESIDRELFLSQSVLREHIEKFKDLDAVILTCSNVSAKSFLVTHGLPKDITPQSLEEQGAIGDVLGHYLDADGNSVSSTIENRTIGMPLEQVKNVPEKIMAAAGEHKVEIIRASIKRGLVDTLLTDDVTAQLLLQSISSD